MKVAIIQARMSSTRLPGKVLLPLNGKPVLGHVVDRVRQAQYIEKVVVATSTQSEDGALASWCEENGIDCYRGSLQDVLARYYAVARTTGAEHIVRITGDCPLIDPLIIDACIVAYEGGRYDYLSNCTTGPRTFPRGLDTEIFSFSALERAFRESQEAYEREHVTPYLWQNKKNEFQIAPVFTAAESYARPQYRLTLDYPQDYELFKHLYTHVPRREGIIFTPDVLAYLDAHPDVAEINAHCEQAAL